jgi:hypothetical protein
MAPGRSESRVRTELTFPDLPGFRTLKCDLHLHTVFSDGRVWPDLRVEEAWRDGLDAIAITDHIEYLPHKADLPANYPRPYEIARVAARELGVLVIRGAEITRGEPPGHWNALFLTNVAALNQTNYLDALSNAVAQGAFVFWNHPGWKQPNWESVWYKEQQQVLERGWLHGIEVVNGSDYDPIAQRWCIEKNLTMLGNSDAHDPIAFDYTHEPGNYRPMTLVFAKERSVEGIQEALRERRTAIYSEGRLIGSSTYLKPLFHESIQVVNPEIRIRGKGRALVQIRNRGPLPFSLRLNPKLPELDVQEKVVLAPGKVSLVWVQCMSARVAGEQTVPLPCKVLNLLSEPSRALTTSLPVKVTFEPAQ